MIETKAFRFKHIERISDIKFTNGIIYLRKQLKSKTYTMIEQNQITNLRNNNQHLYETVGDGHSRRLFMDLDKCSITYEEIIQLINDFIVFIRVDYNAPIEVTYRIHISLLNGQHTMSLNTTYKSVHIIFNVYTETYLQASQIVNEFKQLGKPNSSHIDTAVYSILRIFRTLHQSKEQSTDSNGVVTIRKDRLYAVEKVGNQIQIIQNTQTKNNIGFIENNEDITPADFITYIDKKCVRLEVVLKTIIPIKKQRIIKSNYNVTYSIDKIKTLEKFIAHIEPTDYIDTKSWKRNLHSIIAVYVISGNSIDDIINEPYIQQYLNESRVGIYDTRDFNNKNIELVRVLYKNPSLLQCEFVYDNETLEFIYRKCGLNSNTHILITEKSRVKNAYNLQYLLDGVVTNSLYVNNKHMLCIDYNIQKSINDITKKTKYIIQSDNQHSLAFDHITHTECIFPAKYKPIKIQSLTEVKRDCIIDTYVTAPVGAGKTYHVLLPDLKFILESSPTSKITIVTDLMSIADKIYDNAYNSLVEWGYDTDILQNYKLAKPSNNTRIFVCCYDSLNKFDKYDSTHLICDEIVNIFKRTYNAMKATNEGLKDSQRYLFNLMRTNVCKFYDADFEEKHMDLICEQTNKTFKVYQLIGYIQSNHTVIIMNESKSFISLIADIRNGKKISISTGNTKLTIELQSAIEALQLNRRILIISAKGAFDNSINTIADINLKRQVCQNTNLWETYDCVIYTPTIQTGISFNNQNYFHRHYSFVESLSADSQQQAQMLFRIRGTISNEIVVSITRNELFTFQKAVVNETSITRIDNFNTMTRSNANNTAAVFLWEQHIIQKYNNPNKNSPLSSRLNDMKIYAEIFQSKMFAYHLFTKAYEWGCINMKCEYFNSITADIYLDEEIDTIPIVTFISDELEKQAFMDAVYLKEIPKVKDTNDRNLDIKKTFGLLYYGISRALHSQAKFNYSALKLSLLPQPTPIETIWELVMTEVRGEQMQNPIDIDYIRNDTQHFRSTFQKANQIKYYEVRELIYQMFDIAFIDKNVSLEEYVNLSVTTNDTMKFIKFIYGLYVSFKIFDLISEDYVVVNSNSIIPDYITELYINDGNIVTIKKSLIPKIKAIFETVKVTTLYNYIATSESSYLIENNLKQGIRYAFKQIGLDYKQGRVNEPITIKLGVAETNLRIQKFRFMRDELCDEDYTQNELDDINYWIRDKRLIENKKLEAVTIQYNNQPKIQLLRQDYGTDSKGMKDMTLLRHYIDTYCIRNSITTQTFELCDKKIKDSFISQTDFVYEDSIRYWYTDTKEDIAVEKKESTKIKQAEKINLKKEVAGEKKESTKIKQAEIIQCECGGQYNYKGKCKHINTAKHLKWEINKMTQSETT